MREADTQVIPSDERVGSHTHQIPKSLPTGQRKNTFASPAYISTTNNHPLMGHATRQHEKRPHEGVSNAARTYALEQNKRARYRPF